MLWSRAARSCLMSDFYSFVGFQLFFLYVLKQVPIDFCCLEQLLCCDAPDNALWIVKSHLTFLLTGCKYSFSFLGELILQPSKSIF